MVKLGSLSMFESFPEDRADSVLFDAIYIYFASVLVILSTRKINGVDMGSSNDVCRDLVHCPHFTTVSARSVLVRHLVHTGRSPLPNRRSLSTADLEQNSESNLRTDSFLESTKNHRNDEHDITPVIIQCRIIPV